MLFIVALIKYFVSFTLVDENSHSGTFRDPV